MKDYQINSVIDNLRRYSVMLESQFEASKDYGFRDAKQTNDMLIAEISLYAKKPEFTPLEIVQITNAISKTALKMFNWLEAEIENVEVSGSKLVVDIDFHHNRPAIEFTYEKGGEYVEVRADFPSDLLKL